MLRISRSEEASWKTSIGRSPPVQRPSSAMASPQMRARMPSRSIEAPAMRTRPFTSRNGSDLEDEHRALAAGPAPVERDGVAADARAHAFEIDRSSGDAHPAVHLAKRLVENRHGDLHADELELPGDFFRLGRGEGAAEADIAAHEAGGLRDVERQQQAEQIGRA